MSVKTKTALIITVTLLSGIIIGALLNRTLLFYRIKRTFSMQNPRTFTMTYEKLLSPDNEQEKEIRRILQKHAARLYEIRQKHIKDFQEVNKELEAELDPYLTPRQKKLIKSRFLGIKRAPFGQRRRRFRPDNPFPMKPKPLPEKEESKK